MNSKCMHYPDRRIGNSENHDDIKALLQDIKPSWDKNQLQIERLSGGYSSDIFKCFVKSNPDEAVTVRVRRLLEKCDAAHASPEFETKALQELSRLGRFPPVLAIFNNGYCYEYLKGGPLDGFNVHKPGVLEDRLLRLVARELASVHAVQIPGVDYTRTSYFSNMAALLNNDRLMWKDEWPPQEVLVQEVDVIHEYVAAAKSPLVLCHGDLHSGNIVLNKELDRVTCIDWELAYVGHRACDIAHFVNSFEYVDYLRNVAHERKHDLERLFYQAYLERTFEIRGTNHSTEVMSKNVDQLLSEVTYFKPVVLFQWLIYIVAFWETTEKMSSDTARLVNYNIDRYLQAKEDAFGFRRFGR